MPRRLAVVCGLLCLAFALRGQADQLPDGVYPVVNAYQQDPAISDSSTRVISYNYRIVDSTAQSDRFLEVVVKDYAPLHLDRAPERVRQADDRSHLFLTLDRRAGRQLKRLTRKYAGGRVAMVIGGEAVTMHKIRTPITGGRLQITRCTDDACNYLFLELGDNVRK
ncbi:MAG: hypothetical protein R3330_01495 [Saprospiraceae bacterium]|nr:hypothetical protein [Saprospiraceae bacterium]